MAAQVFWAVFISANGRAKSAQQLITTVPTFHPLYFSCKGAIPPGPQVSDWSVQRSKQVSRQSLEAGEGRQGRHFYVVHGDLHHQ